MTHNTKIVHVLQTGKGIPTNSLTTSSYLLFSIVDANKQTFEFLCLERACQNNAPPDGYGHYWLGYSNSNEHRWLLRRQDKAALYTLPRETRR